MYRRRRPISGIALLLLLAACLFFIGLPFYVTGKLPQSIAEVKIHLNAQLPADKQGYIVLAQEDARASGIPPDLFVRQINQESGFNPTDLSPAGAEGIAQFMPDTAAGLGIDPWNPVAALQGAAQLMARYQHNYSGDYAKALAAYNGGSGILQYCLTHYGSGWFSCESAETQAYIQKIMSS
jgi:soluble lytic murein transglycosylase-like protein